MVDYFVFKDRADDPIITREDTTRVNVIEARATWKHGEAMTNTQVFPEMYTSENPVTHGIVHVDSNNGLEVLLKIVENVSHMYHDMFLHCDNNAERQETVSLIVQQIWKYVNLEQGVLYPLCVWILRDKSVERENLKELNLMKAHLEVLSEADVHDVQFGQQCQQLMSSFERHARRDQSVLFPRLMERLNEQQLDLLYNCLGNAESLAPDRRFQMSAEQTVPDWMDHVSVLVAYNELLQSFHRTDDAINESKDFLKVNPWNGEQ